MRLRFAISGQKPDAETKEPVVQPRATKPDTVETKVGTIEPADTTNNETKIEAVTGN